MLSGLRHRSICRGDDQNCSIHLRRSGDHILDVVGMSGAVDVRVVALGSLIFYVGYIDRNAPLSFFRRLIDLVVGHELSSAALFQYLGNRGSQRRLSMIDVTDGSDVKMRLFPLKLLFAHLILL